MRQAYMYITVSTMQPTQAVGGAAAAAAGGGDGWTRQPSVTEDPSPWMVVVPPPQQHRRAPPPAAADQPSWQSQASAATPNPAPPLMSASNDPWATLPPANQPISDPWSSSGGQSSAVDPWDATGNSSRKNSSSAWPAASNVTTVEDEFDVLSSRQITAPSGSQGNDLSLLGNGTGVCSTICT